MRVFTRILLGVFVLSSGAWLLPMTYDFGVLTGTNVVQHFDATRGWSGNMGLDEATFSLFLIVFVVWCGIVSTFCATMPSVARIILPDEYFTEPPYRIASAIFSVFVAAFVWGITNAGGGIIFFFGFMLLVLMVGYGALTVCVTFIGWIIDSAFSSPAAKPVTEIVADTTETQQKPRTHDDICTEQM